MAPKPPVARLESPALPKFFAWVVVDGVEAPIYDVKVDGIKAVGFIEAQEGKQYVVNYRFEEGLPITMDQAIDLYIDGSPIASHSATRERVRSVIRCQNSFTGQELSNTVELPFIFDKVKVTDDDAQSTHVAEIIRNAGTIQVKSSNMRITGPCVASYAERVDAPMLHERAKKAHLSHTTKPLPIPQGEAKPAFILKLSDSDSSDDDNSSDDDKDSPLTPKKRDEAVRLRSEPAKLKDLKRKGNGSSSLPKKEKKKVKTDKKPKIKKEKERRDLGVIELSDSD